MFRDQSGNGSESGGYCEHPAVPPDAQVLEGEALSTETTGEINSFPPSDTNLLFSYDQILFHKCDSTCLSAASVSSQDLIDEWKAKEIKRGNSNKTIDPSSLKWTPPKGT